MVQPQLQLSAHIWWFILEQHISYVFVVYLKVKGQVVSCAQLYDIWQKLSSTDFRIGTTELPHQELTQIVSHIPVQEVSRKATVKTVTE